MRTKEKISVTQRLLRRLHKEEEVPTLGSMGRACSFPFGAFPLERMEFILCCLQKPGVYIWASLQ